MSRIEEAWAVRLGDSFSGPNEHVLLLVQDQDFVAVGAQVPGLLTAIRADLERLSADGKLRCATAVRLPRGWQFGFGLLPTANVEPLPRPRRELTRAMQDWQVVDGNYLEEVYAQP